jgi:hypothetical protein
LHKSADFTIATNASPPDPLSDGSSLNPSRLRGGLSCPRAPALLRKIGLRGLSGTIPDPWCRPPSYISSQSLAAAPSSCSMKFCAATAFAITQSRRARPGRTDVSSGFSTRSAASAWPRRSFRRGALAPVPRGPTPIPRGPTPITTTKSGPTCRWARTSQPSDIAERWPYHRDAGSRRASPSIRSGLGSDQGEGLNSGRQRLDNCRYLFRSRRRQSYLASDFDDPTRRFLGNFRGLWPSPAARS